MLFCCSCEVVACILKNIVVVFRNLAGTLSKRTVSKRDVWLHVLQRFLTETFFFHHPKRCLRPSHSTECGIRNIMLLEYCVQFSDICLWYQQTDRFPTLIKCMSTRKITLEFNTRMSLCCSCVVAALFLKSYCVQFKKYSL